MLATTNGTIAEQPARTVVRLTECHGTNQEKRRDVWINPMRVTRFSEYHLYGSGQRVTMIRFGAEDWVWVEESPELVASELGWS